MQRPAMLHPSRVLVSWMMQLKLHTLPPPHQWLQDLAHLLGPSWRSSIPASAAAAAYAAHLQQLADSDPVLLLPYAFSLYVPILLGFLAQRIQRNLQLPDERGLAFFTVSDTVFQQKHTYVRVSLVSQATRCASSDQHKLQLRATQGAGFWVMSRSVKFSTATRLGWADTWAAAQPEAARRAWHAS